MIFFINKYPAFKIKYICWRSGWKWTKMLCQNANPYISKNQLSTYHYIQQILWELKLIFSISPFLMIFQMVQSCNAWWGPWGSWGVSAPSPPPHYHLASGLQATAPQPQRGYQRPAPITLREERRWNIKIWCYTLNY